MYGANKKRVMMLAGGIVSLNIALAGCSGSDDNAKGSSPSPPLMTFNTTSAARGCKLWGQWQDAIANGDVDPALWPGQEIISGSGKYSSSDFEMSAVWKGHGRHATFNEHGMMIATTAQEYTSALMRTLDPSDVFVSQVGTRPKDTTCTDLKVKDVFAINTHKYSKRIAAAGIVLKDKVSRTENVQYVVSMKMARPDFATFYVDYNGKLEPSSYGVSRDDAIGRDSLNDAMSGYYREQVPPRK